MSDLPSRLDLYAIGRDYVLQKATKIDPGQVDVVGSDVNIFVGSQSNVGYGLVKQLAFRTGALLLDGITTDDDLDRYAWDRYQLSRKGASPALGAVSFSRVSFALGAGSIPIGTIIKSATGIQYQTTTIGIFGSTDVGPISVSVQAVQAGKATQVTDNQLTIIQNPTVLWDQTLTVTNPLTTAGGEDTEDFDTFKNRIRQFWTTARRGTLGAIQFGALAVPGVVSAQAVDVTTTTGQPARVVLLYIADSSGVASNELAALVQNALNDYRAGGIAVIVVTSLPQIVSVVMQLAFATGSSSQVVAQAVQAAVVNFINSLPVNGPLYIFQLGTVLQRFASQGLLPNFSTITVPAGDVIPLPGQTIRTTPANVSVLPVAA